MITEGRANTLTIVQNHEKKYETFSRKKGVGEGSKIRPNQSSKKN